MNLLSLTIKQFRCFESKKLTFSQQNIVIQGHNGSGKTSVLEAIYFLSFLRSFRTSHLVDLAFFNDDLQTDLAEKHTSLNNSFKNTSIPLKTSPQTPITLPLAKNNQSPSFFLSAQFIDDNLVQHEVSFGFFQNKKQILLNKKKPTSLRELFFAFPVFSITENDLDLIKGEPDLRRCFVDNSISFLDPQYKKKIRALKSAILQRNALLLLIHQKQKGSTFNQKPHSLLQNSLLYNEDELHLSLNIWTHSLWSATCEVERERVLMLGLLEKEVNSILEEFYKDKKLTFKLNYKAKNRDAKCKYEVFLKEISELSSAEISLKRSLFGAHLDDIEIILKQKNAKNFASRGQQKLLIFLIKIAQYRLLKKECPQKGILLLDDFITDFDKENLKKTLEIIKIEGLQTILTCPINANEVFPKETGVEIINFFQEKE